MKVTFIIKDVTDYFFTGFGDSIRGLDHMTEAEKFQYLNKTALDKALNVKMKIGNDSFRDKVELNQIIRKSNVKYSYKLENRRGYKLATFIVE